MDVRFVATRPIVIIILTKIVSSWTCWFFGRLLNMACNIMGAMYEGVGWWERDMEKVEGWVSGLTPPVDTIGKAVHSVGYVHEQLQLP